MINIIHGPQFQLPIKKLFLSLMLFAACINLLTLASESAEVLALQPSGSNIPMDCNTRIFNAALLSRQSLQEATKGKYSDALNHLCQAAEHGDEFAIRYLTHSYKQGGLLTGFSKYQYEHFKKLKKALAKSDPAHKSILKSLIRMAEQRLISVFEVTFPEYKELLSLCNINNQSSVSPYLVLMKLFEKYLATDEINDYWDALEKIVTKLNSDYVYDVITMVMNTHTAKKYPRYATIKLSVKESNVIDLIMMHATQKQLPEEYLQQLECALNNFSDKSGAQDPFFGSVIKQIEICSVFDREFALRRLETLLVRGSNAAIRDYFALLQYAATRDMQLFTYYAEQYLLQHLTDLLTFALMNPSEMKQFEGTLLSIDAIIMRTFEAAHERTNFDALRHFLLNGAAWFATYDTQIKEIFPELFNQRSTLFGGILALLKSASPELKKYCFETLIEQLADLEHSLEYNNYWVKALFSVVDIGGIKGQGRFDVYMNCRNKFIEKNAPRSLQILNGRFPEYNCEE